MSQSGLHISRSAAYRLRQQARDEDKAALVFLDDRHGHPYKLTKLVCLWMVEFCTNNPQVASSRVQAELKSTFGIEVSVRQINRVRTDASPSTVPCLSRAGRWAGSTGKSWVVANRYCCTMRKAIRGFQPRIEGINT